MPTSFGPGEASKSIYRFLPFLRHLSMSGCIADGIVADWRRGAIGTTTVCECSPKQGGFWPGFKNCLRASVPSDRPVAGCRRRQAVDHGMDCFHQLMRRERLWKQAAIVRAFCQTAARYHQHPDAAVYDAH